MSKLTNIVAFLQQCPTISNNPLYFTIGKLAGDSKKLAVNSTDRSLHKPYIDGGVEKRYTVDLDCFKSLNNTPLTDSATEDSNIESFQEVQGVIDWITQQDDAHTYPSLGNKCIVDSMKSLTEEPKFIGVDNISSPNYAVYRITIQIDYLDNTKTIIT